MRPSTRSALLLGVWLILSVGRCPGQAMVAGARITTAIDENKLANLPGNVHPLARPEFDRGLVDGTQAMNRMLLLLQRSPEQESALLQLLDEQQSKASPSYHTWLTPAQFGQQFGPADADIQTVTQWLTAQGFTNIKVGAGRSVIEFSGNVAQVRNAFHTEIHQYHIKGESHLANASDPQIPAALAPVIAGIVSLNNFPVKSHMHLMGTFQKSKPTGEVKPLFTFSGCQLGTCYAVGPPDFATIYDSLPLLSASPKIDGTGQTIAIVGETNINVQDVADFRTIFGLPQNFTSSNIILNGPDPGINSSEGESDVDVQWSGAVAPGATINLVTSASTETTSGVHLSAVYIVDNNVAGIISESFGECEQNLGSTLNQFYSSLWEQAAAQGITVILSAGDGGSAGCDNFDTQQTASHGLAVSGFASTPFNVAVGGTDFDQAGRQSQFWNTTSTTTTPPVPASALKYIPEVPWNDSCAQLGLSGCGAGVNPNLLNIAAGSGGSSTIYAKPTWQIGVPGMPADNHRDLPDVALFAGDGSNDSFYIMCERDLAPTGSCNVSEFGFTFQAVGGTSVSAPAFAGIIALVNQKQATAQVPAPRQGNANYLLYALMKKQASSTPPLNCVSSSIPASGCIFNDINKGNNAVPCAGGSPNCSSLVSGTNGVLVEPGKSSTPAFPATSGYDLATGLGSVNVLNLVNNWSTVNLTATNTSLVLNNNNPVNITHGSSVPVQVNLTPSAATGDVSLIADLGNGKTVGFDTLTLGTNGAASGTTTALPGGTNYLVHAHYAGDGTNATSDSTPPVSVTVTAENSKTFASLVTLDINGNPTSFATNSATYGSGYFLLRLDVGDSGASVSPSTGITSNCSKHITSCPTGTIALSSNGAPLAGGSLALNSQGFAEDQSIPPGNYSISATYPGDLSYGPSSGTANFTIAKAPTTTTAGVAGLPVQYGNFEEIIADVATTSDGIAPTGTFIFSVDGSAVTGPIPVSGSGPYIPNSSPPHAWANAVSSTAFLSVGQHTLTAQYSGDANYAPSTSAPSSVTVTQALPFFNSYGASPGSANLNQRVTLSAQLFGSDSGVPPKGTFTFFDGSNSLAGTVTYTSVGSTTLTGSALQGSMPYTPTTLGVHNITVSYSGDANYLPATTPVPATLTVIGPDFILTPQASSATVTAGGSATYTIAVAGTNGFNSNVSVSCSIVATAAACTPGASNPASVAVGSGATITVTTTARGLVTPIDATRRFGPVRMFMPLSLLSVLALVLFVFGARTPREGLVLSAPAAGLVLFLALEAFGCGGGSSGNTSPPPPAGTPAGAYTVMITGTSGATTHTVTTTLIVN